MIDEVLTHLEDLVDAGIIRKSYSSWASPVVLCRKKNGKIRMCVDYRKQNLNFPTPTNSDHLRSFLALTGYYHKFIKDFSKLAKPLNDLLPPTTAKNVKSMVMLSGSGMTFVKKHLITSNKYYLPHQY